MSSKLISSLPILSILSISSLLISIPTAHAQSADSEAPSNATDPLFVLAPDDDASAAQPYSPAKAMAWSLLGTGAGVGLLALSMDDDIGVMAGAGLLALTVGPSLGHMYTRDWKRALIGSGIRAAGITTTLVGLASMMQERCYTDEEVRTCVAIVIGGMAALAGGTIYSVVASPSSARRANERARRQLYFAPTAMSGPSKKTGVGVMLGGTF